jgi:hypothetical protein
VDLNSRKNLMNLLHSKYVVHLISFSQCVKFETFKIAYFTLKLLNGIKFLTCGYSSKKSFMCKIRRLLSRNFNTPYLHKYIFTRTYQGVLLCVFVDARTCSSAELLNFEENLCVFCANFVLFNSVIFSFTPA